MNKFNTELEIKLVGEQLFDLISELEYENEKLIIKVKKGFRFNGANIPKALWSLYGCPFGGTYTLSACIHDALYATHLFSKKECDKIFLEAMLASGVEDVIANQFYLAVNIMGNKPYNNANSISMNRELVEIISKEGLW